MPTGEATVDALIFGGGIAGLWTLARLRIAGYSCILVQTGPMGGGQTIASQGIIHGGVKYALTGRASRASRAISEMPRIWRSCLAGEGEVDLRAARVLSESQVIWTSGRLGSRLAGLAASKAIRTPVERISPTDEGPFRGAPRGTGVYRVQEQVLDVGSVVGALAGTHQDCIIQTRGPDSVRVRPEDRSVRAMIVLGDSQVQVTARAAVLAAGAGNESLLRTMSQSGGDTGDPGVPIRMQRRPLHMVMARGNRLPALFGHCIGLSDKPRITVTSHPDRSPEAGSGSTVWYIGGQIAEQGVERDPDEQAVAAAREVTSCLPWIDLTDVEWATFRVDRAEGLTKRGARPDEPVVRMLGNAVVVWPTKLAFAPDAASRVLACFAQEGISAQIPQPDLPARPALSIAEPPWNAGDIRWHS